MGAKMKQAAALIGAFSQQEIATTREKPGQIAIQVDGENYQIQLAEVEIAAEDIPGWSVASKGALTVALDIVLSEDLKHEGDARELVNRIQNIRKENGFELTDRIFVKLLESDGFKQSIIKFNDYICREILADNIEWVSTLPDGVEIEINETLLKLAVTKKG